MGQKLRAIDIGQIFRNDFFDCGPDLGGQAIQELMVNFLAGREENIVSAGTRFYDLVDGFGQIVDGASLKLQLDIMPFAIGANLRLATLAAAKPTSFIGQLIGEPSVGFIRIQAFDQLNLWRAATIIIFDLVSLEMTQVGNQQQFIFHTR
jgi:hypothetical protein